MGKAALWRAPDSFDATPAKIPTHFEMKVRGVEARAENLGNSLREQHGVKLNFDEESLLRLDDLIDRLVKPPVDPQKLSTVVVPWADFLTKAVAVVFSGHLFQDPGNGIRVRIATRSGIIATSPDSQMWSRLEQGRNDETSITRYIERLKQEVKLRGGLQR